MSRRKAEAERCERLGVRAKRMIVTYMDVDLSTDLEELPKLIGAVATPCALNEEKELHRYKVTRLQRSKELNELNEGKGLDRYKGFMVTTREAEIGSLKSEDPREGNETGIDANENEENQSGVAAMLCRRTPY